jgi:hypothetical protein
LSAMNKGMGYRSPIPKKDCLWADSEAMNAIGGCLLDACC